MDPKNINPQINNPISLPSLENKKARVNPRIIIIIVLVFILIIGLIFLSIKLTKKPSSGLKETQNGIFVSFSAIATGKVTKISKSNIEIENNGVRKNFRISDNVLISQKSLLDKIANILVPEVEAQLIPPRPSLPPQTTDTKASSNSGIPNVPPAPRKNVGEIKVGDFVSLSLSKERENAEWIVTGISLIGR